jgi:hypothetical protein
MVGGNNNCKTAMALRAVAAMTTATATALRAVVVATDGNGNGNAERAVVAATRGNPAVGGDDDGDSDVVAMGVAPRRSVAGRGRYVVRMAGADLPGLR